MRRPSSVAAAPFRRNPSNLIPHPLRIVSVTQPLHLVSVWNPSYAAGAMDDHIRILLRWIERQHAGTADPDEVYVWWGRIRSPNRQQGLPHDAQVLALDDQIRAGIDTHLYLTDFRSLYVAHLGEVTADSVLDDEGEADHAPDYYRQQMVDHWYRLFDLRLVVWDDTLQTIELLRKLRNTQYADRPVSLYGGMRDLPLVVREDPPQRWFSDAGILLDDRWWVERDAEMRGDTARMALDLRDNLLSPTIWAALEPTTRTFLASAEAVFRSRASDPAFTFSGPAVEYAKAVEVELNALLMPALARFMRSRPEAERTVRLGNRPVDLIGPVPHQTLGVLRVMLEHEDSVRAALRSGLPQDGNWLVGTVPNRLQVLEDLRNPAAHSGQTWREQVTGAREEILGIGQPGLIVELARAKLRSR